MEMLVSERVHYQSGFAIQDTNGGVESARINMRGVLKLRILVRLESAAAAPVITLNEHDAASAGTSQALEIKLPHTYRVDGSDAVKVEATASAIRTITALNGDAGYVTIEVEGQNLSEGFEWISLNVDGLVASRNGSATYEAETEDKPAYAVTL